MSFHNPYLSASRPSSSYTRSSRSSKRNEPSTNKSSYLSRSRSSMTLGGGSGLGSQSLLSTQTTPSSSYHLDTSSAYVPSTSWNRPSSTSRLASSPSKATPSNLTTFVPGLRTSTSQSNLLTQQQQVPASSSILTPLGASSASNIKRGVNDSVTQQSASGANSRSSSVLSLDSSLHHADHQSSEDENLDINKSSQQQLQQRNNSNPLSKQNYPDKYRSSSQDILDSNSTVSDRSISLESSLALAETLNQSELRRSYKELLIENEKLTKQLKEYEDNEKKRNQDWSREKRQMQRKISELEEENKQLEQWKHESQRLKDENSSLLRVISKISK